MNRTKIVFALVSGFALGAFGGNSVTDSENHVLEDEYRVEVASGDTLTLAGVISGDGHIRKEGAGVLVLSNGGNTFAGGIYINGGQVRADAEGCLGTGLVTITPTGASQIGLNFNIAGAAFANAIRVEGRGGGSDNPALLFSKSTVMNGGITNACTSYETSSTDWPYYHAISGADVTFNGPLCSLPANNKAPLGLKIDNIGVMRINGGISCMRFNPAIGGYGNLYLGSGADFSEIQLGYPNLHLLADNAIPTNIPFHWTMCPHNDSRQGNLNLDGHDQTFTGLSWNSSGRDKITGGDSVVNTAERTSTLTLHPAASSYTTYCALNGNLNLVVDAKKSTYTQILGTNRNNTISGEIIVSNGVLRADRTWFRSLGALRVKAGAKFEMHPVPGAFDTLKTLEVAGTFDLTGWAEGENPFSDHVTDLELASGASLKLPETMAVRMKSLKVDGSPLPAGRYAAGAPGTPAAIESGTIFVGISSVTWNAGGGDDTRASLAANWSGTLPDPEDPPQATVGTAGSVVTVEAPLSLLSLALAPPTDEGYTFVKGGETASLAIGVGGLAAMPVPEGRAADTNRFEVPVSFHGAGTKTLDVPTNSVMVFAAGLNETDGATVTMNNTGTVVLAGDSDLRGTFNCSNGTWFVSGVIGPDDTDAPFRVQARSTELKPDSSEPWLWAKIVLDGVTFKKPFWAEADNMFANSAKWLTCTAGKTNTFCRQVVFDRRTVNFVMNGATCICEEGISVGGKLYVNGGHMIIRGGDQALYCSDEFVRMEKNSTLDVYSSGNRWGSRYVMGVAAATSFLNLHVDHALDAESSSYSSLNATNLTVDVFGTHQSVRKLSGKNGSVTGTAGSRIDVLTGGDMAGDLKGALSLWMCGRYSPMRLLLRDRSFSTTGDLVCTNGTVEVASSASWHGGVKAIDEGVIEVAAADAFDSATTVMTLRDNGRVNVPTGVTVKVAELWLDNAVKPARSGTYGAAGSGAAFETAHITGGGFVKVINHGMRVYLR